MELKVFRDVLPAAGADCTAKAELPLETELLISDYLPPVQRIVKCFAKPVVLQKQLAPGRLTLEGYLRCTVYYQGEEGAGLCQTEQKLPFTKALELPSFAATAWTACVEGQTEYLNCRAVNPRRIRRAQNRADVAGILPPVERDEPPPRKRLRRLGNPCRADDALRRFRRADCLHHRR